MPCANESVLTPLQNAGQWATPTDPITEEAIWVRADVAGRVAERLIARAVAGDPGLLLGVEHRRVRAPRTRVAATTSALHLRRWLNRRRLI
jgi:hypothetical protein